MRDNIRWWCVVVFMVGMTLSQLTLFSMVKSQNKKISTLRNLLIETDRNCEIVSRVVEGININERITKNGINRERSSGISGCNKISKPSG